MKTFRAVSLMTAVVIAAAFVMPSLTTVVGASRRTAISKGAASRVRHLRWEYCIIKGVNSSGKDGRFTGYAHLCYVSPSGCREVKVEGTNEDDALTKAIGRLAEDGWEAVAAIPYKFHGESAEGFLFRRGRK